MTLNFTNVAPRQWDCVATVSDTAGGASPNVTINGGGSILVEFDANGNPISPAGPDNPQLDITLVNGAKSPLSVDWTFMMLWVKATMI